jgi:hypothetical protein
MELANFRIEKNESWGDAGEARMRVLETRVDCVQGNLAHEKRPTHLGTP